MSSYEIGLLAHLLGVLLFFGGALVAGVLFEAARRRARPSEVALLLGVTRIGALLVGIGALLTLGAGLWLADEVDQFDERWLQLSLVLFVLSLVLGALGGQRPKQARRLASRLAEDDVEAVTPELRRLLDEPLSLVANYASSALVLVILVLMVWQPGR